MSNWKRDLRNRKESIKWFPILVLFWGMLGIVLLVGRAILGETPDLSLLVTSFYFTAQSNIFLTLIVILFLLGFSEKKWFKNLSFIALVNIIITGVIFHSLLKPNIADISFTRHVLHTINPILYLIFYFSKITGSIPIKMFWISLIYPLLYLSLVYFFIEPLFGDLLNQAILEYEGARYVYPFLDPSFYDSGIYGLLIFIFVILAPSICLLALILILIKLKFEKKIQAKII